ncbi:urotensin II-related peptide precursor [Oryzias latipes]|uniref:Urotensin II-related peptide n=1 Tax=Oryzias latipes TaxID=8090 RepID=H9DV61_ORYLA|nr:urotensin II-related peptide precursor [Oryzias latipes]AFD64562.1 urotensin II-related peptide precursor [Oryzias latipes]
MERFSLVNYCLGLLGVLVLQGLITVEGRNIFNAGNQIFNPDDVTQSKILELLLPKNEVPIEKNSLVDVELANKFADLKELLTLKEELELERTIAKMAEGKSLTNKRGEPCFWKYCV